MSDKKMNRATRLTNLIDMWEAYFDIGERKDKESHWPSEVTSCSRQLYWRWTKEQKTDPIIGGDWWRIKIGVSIHNLIQALMMEISGNEDLKKALAWEGFEANVEVRSGKVAVEGLTFPFSYREDLVFTDFDGEIAGIDIKTTYGYGTTKIKENGPKASTLMQIICYLELADRKRYYIPHVARDSADRVLYIMEKEPDGYILSRMYPSGDDIVVKRIPRSVWDKAKAKLRAVEVAVETKQIPDRPYLVAIKDGVIRDKFQKDKVDYKSDWQCMYCPFKARCWSEIARRYAPELGPNGEVITRGSDNSGEFKLRAERGEEAEDE